PPPPPPPAPGRARARARRGGGAAPPAPGSGSGTARRRAAIPESPPADLPAESDEASQPLDDDGQTSASPGRASLGQRLAAGSIDLLVHGLIILLAFLLIGRFGNAAQSEALSQHQQQRSDEMRKLAEANHAAAFLRILDREAFPQHPDADQFQSFIADLRALDASSPPEMVLDEIIHFWRERQASAEAPLDPEARAALRAAPITPEEREQVVLWRQYEEFQAHVERTEIAYRRNLLQIAGVLAQIDRRMSQELSQAAQRDALGRVLTWLAVGLLLLLIMPVSERLLGGSLGKVLMGLRVANLGRVPPSTAALIMRQVYRLPLLTFFGVFRAEGQGFHDALSRTQVIAREALLEAPASRRGPGRRAPGRTRTARK
ncbi:MAG: hypothetical protein EA402_04885, partial [Planctomycetota bacterium]